MNVTIHDQFHSAMARGPCHTMSISAIGPFVDFEFWVHTCYSMQVGEPPDQKWYPILVFQNKYPTLDATVVLSPPTCGNGLWPTCFPCWICFFLPRQRSAIVKACNVLQTLQGHRSSVSRGMQKLKPRVPLVKGILFLIYLLILLQSARDSPF